MRQQIPFLLFALGAVFSLCILGEQSYGQIPTQGIVAYYPFNGNANDESGNGHNAIVHGVTLTTDRFGQANKAYSFDGGDGHYIDLGSWQMGGPTTICGWVLYSTSFNDYQRFIEIGTWDLDDFFITSVNYTSEAALATFHGPGDSKGLTADNFFVLNTWVFVVATAEGTTMKLYKNGSLFASTTDGYELLNTTRINQWLGRSSFPNPYFMGKMDDIRIYSRVLTDAEILSLYNEPMPVELVSCNATILNDAIRLNWKTATEVNNYGFEVERREIKNQNEALFKIDWVCVGFVSGAGASGAPHEYNFTDSKLGAGRYAYRLKQIDNGGAFRYSQSVEVEVGTGPKVFSLSQNYPNPFNPTTTFSFSLPSKSFVSLKVYDLLGREVATIVSEEMSAGSYSKQWNPAGLPSGVCFYRLKAGNFTETKKLVFSK